MLWSKIVWEQYHKHLQKSCGVHLTLMKSDTVHDSIGVAGPKQKAQPDLVSMIDKASNRSHLSHSMIEVFSITL